MGIIGEFKEFLREYKVMGMAVAIVMGLASVALVNAIVANLIMPIISPLISGGDWQTATLTLGSIIIGWGALLAAIINFVIIAFVIFLIAKYAFKEDKVTKK